MITLFIFLSVFAHNSNAAAIPICIGDRCSGQKVSLDYLANHPFLETSDKDFFVKSFKLSFYADNNFYEKQYTGNTFYDILPKLKRVKVGEKIHFDQVCLVAKNGSQLNTSGVFTLETYTDTRRLHIGEYFGGDTIPYYVFINGTLRHIDTNYRVVQIRLTYTLYKEVYDNVLEGNNLYLFNYYFLRNSRYPKIYLHAKLRHAYSKDVIMENTCFILK